MILLLGDGSEKGEVEVRYQYARPIGFLTGLFRMFVCRVEDATVVIQSAPSTRLLDFRVICPV